MLKHLTTEEIEIFASRKGVRRNAVVNFLCTVHFGGVDFHFACENAKADARSYNWNDETLEAIIDGIVLSENKKGS